MNEKYGLLGEKLGHSISPEIHSLILKNLNISGTYDLIEVKCDALKEKMSTLKISGFRGVNVTIPYKVEVMKYIDSISREAQDIGAVNTIYFDGENIKGYNTDYIGFGMLLEKNDIKVKGENVVVLGTGGAAKMAVRYAEDNGAGSVTVVSRDTSRKDTISYDDLKSLKNCGIIINCTPCGMYPNVGNSPIDKNVISKFRAAVDIIYNPAKTLFLKYADEAGVKAVNGLYMLVGQAVAAQEIWNDIKIDKNVIDKIYNEVGKLDKIKGGAGK